MATSFPTAGDMLYDNYEHVGITLYSELIVKAQYYFTEIEWFIDGESYIESYHIGPLYTKLEFDIMFLPHEEYDRWIKNYKRLKKKICQAK